MRIGVDCRLSGPTHAGIGRYIQNLVQRLPQLAPDVEWVYFFHDQAQAKQVLGEVMGKVKVVLTPVRHYSLAEQLKLPGFFSAQKLDLLHVPHFNVPLLYRGQVMVTIHDLLWHEYRGPDVTTLTPWKYWFKYLAYRLVTTQAIKRAVKVLVPAQTIKKTLGEYYPEAAGKIVVTKEGVDTHLVTDLASQSQAWPESVATLLQSHRPFLIYVGSLYPHKNVKLVINSLRQLPEYTLVLVGSRNVFQEHIRQYVKNLGLEQQVIFAGYLSDGQLAQLEQKATALIQPSLSEGFGLTGVEAMALGVPVLASDIPIFREIYQDAAVYFDPHSVEALVRAVQTLHDQDRGLLANRGRKIIKEYSWDTMTQQTLTEYQHVTAI